MLELRDCDFAHDDLDEIAGLLQETFPAASYLTARYLDWAYNRSPLGPAAGCSGFEAGRRVAHVVGRRLRARVHGHDERGVLIHHAATRPEHAGAGLFTALVERTLESVAAEGCSFAISIVNANSDHAMVHKLGFQPVAHLSVRVGLGPLPVPTLRSDLEFETIWDEPVLAWRLGRPDGPYRQQRRGDRRLVLAPTGIGGIQAVLGEIPESFAGVSLPDVSRRHPMRVWIGLDDARDWSRSLYLPVPVRMRPAPLHFTFRDLSGRGRTLDRTRARIDALDFDPY